MGLASKLNAGPAPATPPQQPSFDAFASQQPAQPGWQAFPSQQPPPQAGFYPSISYGQPAAPQQGFQPGNFQQPQQQFHAPYPGSGYGAGPAAGGADPALRQSILSVLQKTVQNNKLQAFFPTPRLQHVTERVAAVDLRQLAQRWRMPVELALDMVALALYDIIIYADDSTSMKYNEERMQDLEVIVSRVAEVATLFDDDGITVRYMNSNAMGDHLRTADVASAFVKQNSTFEGMTPLGTSLQSKIIEPLLKKPIKSRSLDKPLLVITVTDGEPTSEPESKIFQVIKDVKKMCSKSSYGAGAVAFEFAQVGRDQDAQRFLARLDNDKDVGGMVDATSYYELEAEECAAKGVTLSPELWLVKLMVGAIDPSYDEQD